MNGDLSITPADAQRAFEIFPGKIPSPSSYEKENADVTCDGNGTRIKEKKGLFFSLIPVDSSDPLFRPDSDWRNLVHSSCIPIVIAL